MWDVGEGEGMGCPFPGITVVWMRVQHGLDAMDIMFIIMII